MNYKNLLKQFLESNKVSFLKEIKEIKAITSDDVNIKGLFTINILVNIFEEKIKVEECVVISNETYKKRDELAKDLIAFVASPMLMNYLFEKEDFLKPYIDEKKMENLLNNIFLYEDISYFAENVDVASIVSFIENRYIENPQHTAEILKKYKFQFNFLSPKMVGEDVYLNQLENELQKSLNKKNAEKNIPWVECVRGYQTLSSMNFRSILELMNENNLSDRSYAKYLYANKKLIEWKALKREKELYMALNSMSDKETKVERTKNKI